MEDQVEGEEMQDEKDVGVEQGDVGEVQEEDDDEAVIIVESEDEVRAYYYITCLGNFERKTGNVRIPSCMGSYPVRDKQLFP